MTGTGREGWIGMKPMRRHATFLGFILLIYAAPAGAQSFNWLPTNGGLFDAAANWNPAGGPPNAGDTANFDLTSTYTTTFQSNVTTATVNVGNGTVTWQMSGRSLTLTGGSGIVVGTTAGALGRLTLVNGTVSGD